MLVWRWCQTYAGDVQSILFVSGVPFVDIYLDSNHSVLCFVFPLLTYLICHVLETASLEQWPGMGGRDGTSLTSSGMQALNADAPLAEAEQGAALAAWFKVHYAKLDEQGLLFTHLGGAGPEVGVRQKHLSSDVTPQQQRRKYDCMKGR